MALSWFGRWIGSWFGSTAPQPAGSMIGTASISVTGVGAASALARATGTSAITMGVTGTLSFPGTSQSGASCWGISWGSSWGDSWGLLDQQYEQLLPGGRLYVRALLSTLFVTEVVEQNIACSVTESITVREAALTLPVRHRPSSLVATKRTPRPVQAAAQRNGLQEDNRVPPLFCRPEAINLPVIRRGSVTVFAVVNPAHIVIKSNNQDLYVR